MNANYLPDETVIRALGPKMVCTRCEHVNADVRPDWGSTSISGTSRASARGRPSYDAIQFGNIGGNLLNVLIGYVLLT